MYIFLCCCLLFSHSAHRRSNINAGRKKQNKLKWNDLLSMYIIIVWNLSSSFSVKTIFTMIKCHCLCSLFFFLIEFSNFRFNELTEKKQSLQPHVNNHNQLFIILLAFRSVSVWKRAYWRNDVARVSRKKWKINVIISQSSHANLILLFTLTPIY